MRSRRMSQCYINIAIAKTSRGFHVPAVRIKGNKNALKTVSVSLAWRLDLEMRR